MELHYITETTAKKMEEKRVEGHLDEKENKISRLRGCLINTERNQKLLENIPHREFLDLSLVYMEELGGPGESSRYQAADNSRLKKWGVDESGLYDEVCRKMENPEEILLERMDTILGQDGLWGPELDNMPVPLYVLSSKNLFGGAVYMINEEILKRASDMIGGDFSILPSSIHELILVPDSWAEGNPAYVQELAFMVRSVNDTQVPEFEILSYHVYHYSRKTGKVTIAA